MIPNARSRDRGKITKDPPWEAAARAKRQHTLTKLAEARRLWPLPSDEVSTDEIADRVRLSVKALYNHLGPRGLAQNAAGAVVRRKRRRVAWWLTVPHGVESE